jgi:SAM-dependent methyltransferase
MTEHTGASYQGKADAYARMVESKPIYAYYEQPAVLSLLPALASTAVLDAGCGSGRYTEFLVSQGASVTAIDLDPDFVRLTKKRVSEQARVLQADLTKPLDFAREGEFDTVVCSLVMHYLKEWPATLQEFRRVLKPQGILVFTTQHPFSDWTRYHTEDYFSFERVEDEFDCGEVSLYRRPLTMISRDLDETGFYIERLLEPQPTEELRRVDQDEYERLSKNPCFLVVRARKKDQETAQERET